jgi:hypothetical protein
LLLLPITPAVRLLPVITGKCDGFAGVAEHGHQVAGPVRGCEIVVADHANHVEGADRGRLIADAHRADRVVISLRYRHAVADREGRVVVTHVRDGGVEEGAGGRGERYREVVVACSCLRLGNGES